MRWLFDRLFSGLIYVAIRLGAWVVKYGPRRLVYMSYDRLADFTFFFFQRFSKPLVKSLTIEFGDRVVRRALTMVVWKSLINFFRGIVEIGHALSATLEKFHRETHVVGREYMEKPWPRSEGIVISGHPDNFFRLGRCLPGKVIRLNFCSTS